MKLLLDEMLDREIATQPGRHHADAFDWLSCDLLVAPPGSAARLQG